ncbi:hypothetical protein AYO44_09305 [Planctomycetaceae bacterium SCGC AG-212-F19]|nr:hypothetical protein AYO44_09305 [Planctomycetaceae bacterium SCGC AG-212-F19]
MTEEEWWACEETATMMIFLGRRLPHRQRELFFCGVFRLFWNDLSDDCYRRYCEVKERFADGQASEEEMEAANQATAGRPPAFDGAGDRADTPKRETNLLRHIVGNPFRPYTAPASWPKAVVELAQALYEGTGDRLILADALEEAGHQDLAQHFRAEEWHMKGCWVVDVILGKR